MKKLLLIAFVALGFAFVVPATSHAHSSFGISIGFPLGYSGCYGPGYYGYGGYGYGYGYPAYYPRYYSTGYYGGYYPGAYYRTSYYYSPRRVYYVRHHRRYR